MYKVLIVALFLTGCATTQASQGQAAHEATPDGALPSAKSNDIYAGMTPPWLNPKVGTLNSDSNALPANASGVAQP